MKQFLELERDVKDNKEIKQLGMDIAQFIFTKSQENLTIIMPWGDDLNPSTKKPTIITDQSLILLSGIPPHWETDNKIVFEYTAPHANDVENGTPPRKVDKDKIISWLQRKVKVRNKKRAFAWANNIVKKIAREGMDPHPYVRPAIYEAEKKFKLLPISSER